MQQDIHVFKNSNSLLLFVLFFIHNTFNIDHHRWKNSAWVVILSLSLFEESIRSCCCVLLKNERTVVLFKI